jgi:hypothetical protein
VIAALDSTQRLRIGIALAAALLWVFVLLELADRVDAAQTAELRASSQVNRLRLLASEEQWPAFRDTVNQRLAEFRARAWREESEGLVQARVQDWMLERMTESGVTQRELSVSLPSELDTEQGAPLPDEMRLVRARVVFDFQPASFHSLMEALSVAPNWVWVERLQVRNWGTPTVELELGALFIIGPAVPAA